MSGKPLDWNDLPVTAEEDEYFRELQKAQAERRELRDGSGRLGRPAADASGDGSADYGRRPEDWSDHTPSGRRWNVAFQSSSWRHPDAFLTLRRYLNSCPDDTEVWLEDNTLYFRVPTS